MSLEQDIRNALANDATIGPAVLDTSGAIRIYPDTLAQETNFPAITYERVSTQRTPGVSYVHNGGPAGYTGLAWSRITLTVWSDEYSDIATLALALVRLVHRLELAGRSMNSILLERDGREPERGLYKRMIDAKIWFTEST